MDIVDRLNDIAYRIGDLQVVSGEDAGTIEEAAAEITRLRKERDEARAALAWQPIDTAPKYTPILCLDCSMPNPVFVGVWLGHLDDHDNPIDGGSWSFDDPVLWAIRHTLDPTHWMPWGGYPEGCGEAGLPRRAQIAAAQGAHKP